MVMYIKLSSLSGQKAASNLAAIIVPFPIILLDLWQLLGNLVSHFDLLHFDEFTTC